MDFDANLLNNLAGFLTAEDLADLKRSAIKIGVIWAIVEWRTRKRFKTLEEIVTAVQEGFVVIRASISSITREFEEIKQTLQKLIQTITNVEVSDTTSTKLLNDRLQRQSDKQNALENYLSRQGNRVTIIETTLGIVPKDDNKETK